MIVSIHQPNYLPWLGLFDKIRQSDLFVVMDDVQFPRGKNHFGHRNKIKTNNGDKWLTVSLANKSDMVSFDAITLNDMVDWRTEHTNLLTNFYRKAPFYNDYFQVYFDTIHNLDITTLYDMNMELLSIACDHLAIDTPIVRSSTIAPSLAGMDRIMAILECTKATEYISGTGPGSLRYNDEDMFRDRKIKLTWQNYNHPVYKQQFGEFIPNMCFLDLLFNMGPKSRGII